MLYLFVSGFSCVVVHFAYPVGNRLGPAVHPHQKADPVVEQPHAQCSQRPSDFLRMHSLRQYIFNSSRWTIRFVPLTFSPVFSETRLIFFSSASSLHEQHSNMASVCDQHRTGVNHRVVRAVLPGSAAEEADSRRHNSHRCANGRESQFHLRGHRCAFARFAEFRGRER